MDELEILRKIIAAVRQLAIHSTPHPSVMALLDEAGQLVDKLAGPDDGAEPAEEPAETE